MSTLEEAITAVEVIEDESRPDSGLWGLLDRAVTAINQRLNPILVKEARQALKSRQFTVTFTLVLAAAWGWTMLGVAVVGPSIYYGSSGLFLFGGYFVILNFALLVVVPFSAFWSLATERADGTYELLSVTTLTPRHVITGKLASAMLQMLVYYSALAPCLAFTYLLRGIDIPLIGMVMFYMFHGSLGLSAIGLLVATATSERHWQVVLSVFMVAGLLLVFFIASMAAVNIAEFNGIAISDPEFWIGNLAVLSVFWGYFALVVQASSAQLDFPSNNRSTKLRVVMLFQQLLFLGWMTYGIYLSEERAFFVLLLTFSGIHWAVMGAFMVGEAGELSLRVRRQLPQSFLGRAFFTWFNPGSGSGYVFALGSYLALVVLTVIAEMIWQQAAPASYTQSMTVTWMKDFNPLTFGMVMFLYLAGYLGLTRLIMLLLRRAGWGTMFMSLLVTILLILLGCGIPLSIHLMEPFWRSEYSLVEASNPFWTLMEMSEDSLPISQQLAVLALLGLPTGLIVLLNLPTIAREVQQVRASKPRRVVEDDKSLQPSAEPLRKNPWDDGQPANG
ncbi:MAG: hypothetical protein SGJ19_09440 [Planctomycetia bacterium]|nr:hypothetical protein [Planctomycetia bacterium]